MLPEVEGPRESPEEGSRRKVWIIAGLILFVALVVGALIGDRGIFYLIAQQGQAHSLREELETLRTENRRLAMEIAALRSDPRAVERIAREELGLARPGETVFIVREPVVRGR